MKWQAGVQFLNIFQASIQRIRNEERARHEKTQIHSGFHLPLVFYSIASLTTADDNLWSSAWGSLAQRD